MMSDRNIPLVPLPRPARWTSTSSQTVERYHPLEVRHQAGSNHTNTPSTARSHISTNSLRATLPLVQTIPQSATVVKITKLATLATELLVHLMSMHGSHTTTSRGTQAVCHPWTGSIQHLKDQIELTRTGVTVMVLCLLHSIYPRLVGL